MPRISPAPFLLLSAVVLAGCAQFPELDAAISEDAKAAPQPVLMDNRPLLAAASGGSVDETTQATLQARGAALRGRSAGLAGPVLLPGERQEIEAAHDRLRAVTTRVAPDG